MSACTPFKLPIDDDGRPWPIFRELGALPIWCAWSWGPERPEGGRDKPPICLRRDGVPNDKARWGGWQRPENLTTLDEAMAFAELHKLPGVGIVVRPEHGLVIGDFDGSVGKAGAEQWARDILAPGGVTGVYAERSPSGNGLRFIGRARGSVPEKTNGVELFDGTALKFVTITGWHTANSPRELLDGQAVVNAALVRAGKALTGEAAEGHQGGGAGNAEAARASVTAGKASLVNVTPEIIASALAAVPCEAVGYPGWIKVGQALHHQFGGSDDGRDLWDEWSALDEVLYDPAEIEAKWRTFGKRRSPGAKLVTFRTVLDMAKQRGWVQPARTVPAFTSVTVKSPFSGSASGVRAVWPEDTLPRALDVHARQAAGPIGCDPDAARFTFLAVLANCIPARVRYDVLGRGKFLVSANLYAGLVADPGIGKSPILGAALGPIREAEERWARAHEAERKRVERADKAAPKGSPKTHVPSRRRKTVGSVTYEALCAILNDNPDGILVDPDELTGWLGGIDRYLAGSKGGSEEGGFWLKAADAAPHQFDRVGGGRSLFIPRAHVGVIGGIQPGLLGVTLGRHSGDGLLQRFVFAEMRLKLAPDDSPWDEHARAAYEDVVATLLNMAATRGETVLVASPEAAAVNREIEAWVRAKVNDKRESTARRGFYGKAMGLHGRLTLALALIDWATTEAEADPLADEDTLGTVLPVVVSGEVARRARRLWKDFLIPSALNVYGIIHDAGSGQDDVVRLARGILALPETERGKLTEWRCGRIYRGFRGKSRWPALDAAAGELEALGWLTRDESTPGKTAWTIAAAVFDGRFHNEEATGAEEDEAA